MSWFPTFIIKKEFMQKSKRNIKIETYIEKFQQRSNAVCATDEVHKCLTLDVR